MSRFYNMASGSALKNIKFLVLIMFLVHLSGCGGKKQIITGPPENAADAIIVTAEGTADIGNAGLAEATDRAYLDAQRKAIETALGKMYSAKTVVDAGRFIEQTIMAKAEGYIRQWSKLAGPEVQDYPGITEKIVWVKIQASVGKDKLKEDTFALEEIQNKLGRPDVVVVIPNAHAAKVIESKLKDKKFTVRDLPGSEKDPVAAAQEEGIEIIIDGKVEVSGAGQIMAGVNMKSFQSDIIIKAVNTSDGEVLAQSSAHGAYPHINEESGKAGAVERAAQIAADEMLEKLLAAWEDVLNNGSNLYLKVEGLSLEDESDFRMVLKRSMRGLKEVHSKGLAEGVFTYKLMYLGDGKQLAKELSNIESKFGIVVTGYRVNTVTAKVKGG
ncbi:MAG: hypothetical protein ABIH89_01055 [Elusimicrobiota bacterium]